MRSKICTFTPACAIFLLAMMIAGCAKTENAPPNNTAANASNASSRAEVVRAAATGVEVAAGSSAEAAVRVSIAEGFHINANPPALPNLIPTELKIEASDANAGIKAGAPVYPPSMTRKFEFNEQPLKVYEGEATIKLPLRVESNTVKGAHRLQAKLRTQACDHQSCYPPRTIEFAIPLSVK